MDARINKYAVAFALAALTIVAGMGVRSVAQSAKPASNTMPTNLMSGYVKAAQEALVAGTAATNLTEVERSALMNESIKTNLAAQLWFHAAMNGNASSLGARMAVEIRVLETEVPPPPNL